jgi:DeoR/GlpR family transcriptional regulator of sugar metabolism
MYLYRININEHLKWERRELLPNQRHQKILELLEKNGSATVAELVAEFGTSEMTIRRISTSREALSAAQVHGGAMSARGSSYEPPYITRRMENIEKKQRIGKAAAALIKNGDSISLDTGTPPLKWRAISLTSMI